MANFIRSLCMVISSAFFTMIPKLYGLFYDLAAQPMLFLPEYLQKLSNNIYALVSVVMLFALAIKSMAAIVNPELLGDSKKGVLGVLKRAFIALVLIIIIPFGFKLFYQFQTEVMSKSLIERVILGMSIDEGENIDSKYNVGQILAATTLQSVLYPSDGDECNPGVGVGLNLSTIIFPTKTLGDIDFSSFNLCSAYNKAITEDVSYTQSMITAINAETGFRVGTNAFDVGTEGLNGNYYVLTFEYWGLLAVVVSGVIVYMLVLFCIDSAVRLIKMGFLELTAPISVVAYIYGGNDVLKNWFKEVFNTAISFFVRVAALAFMALILTRIPDFISNFNENYKNLARLFLVIGTLIFVKKAPELVEKILGIKINMQGGISGRLGQMAGVGKAAQNAWKSLGTKAGAGLKTAGGLGLAAVGAGVGLGAKAGLKKFDTDVLKGKGSSLLDSLKTSNVGRTMSTGKDVIKSGYSSQGGVLKRAGTMLKSAKDSEFAQDLKYKTDLAKKKQKSDRIKSGMGHNSEFMTNDEARSVIANAASMANKENLTQEQKNYMENYARRNPVISTFDTVSEKQKKLNEKIDKLYDDRDTSVRAKSKLSALKTAETIQDKSRILDSLQGEIPTEKYRELRTSFDGLKSSGLEFNQVLKGMSSDPAKIDSVLASFANGGNLDFGKIVAATNRKDDISANLEIDLKRAQDSTKNAEIKDTFETYKKELDTASSRIAKDTSIGSIDIKETLNGHSNHTLKPSEVINKMGDVVPISNVRTKDLSIDYNATVAARKAGTITSNEVINLDGASVPMDSVIMKAATTLNTTATAQALSEGLISANMVINNTGDVVGMDVIRNTSSSSQGNTGGQNNNGGSSQGNTGGQNNNGDSSQGNTGGQNNNGDSSQGNTGGQNNNGGSSQGNTGGQNNNGGSSQSNNATPDLSSYFEGLSKDIREGTASTNSILSNQLKTQQDLVSESKNQSKTVKDLSSNIDNLNENIGKVSSNMDKVARNIKETNKKLNEQEEDSKDE